MNTDALRDLIRRLSTSASALSALGAALRAKATEHEPAAEIHAHLDEVLAALDVGDDLKALDPAAALPLLADVRMTFLHGAKRVSDLGRAPGWHHQDQDTLQAAGDVSAGFPTMFDRWLPRLDDLGDRLAAQGACFLDVGVGVAALSIQMARRWPSLRVVGIDTWAPALQLARDNLRHEGLLARIELREQAVQDLGDVATFDLAWIPGAFISPAVMPEALRRVHRALRADGWLLFATIAPADEPLSGSLTRLRAAEWGGRAWSAAEAERLLGDCGFTSVRSFGPPAAAPTFIAARRGDCR